MAKTLKNMLEVYAPKSKDEKRFRDKHIVAKSKLDDKGTQDDKVFQATNVKTVDRYQEGHGYNPGMDEKVYESAEYSKHGPKAIVVSSSGKGKYKVHHVGKHFSDGINVGEHLSDSELDDAAEMGAKIINKNTETKTKIKEESLSEKKLTSAEMKKREEVAKAIERENPKMPMGMKMAIATKTAKRVAEEDLHESEGSHKAFQDQHNKAAKTIKDITKTLSDHYNTVTDKKQYNKGEAQWHHVDAIKNINRSLEDLHQRVAQEVDFSRPPQVRLGEDVEVDQDLSELLGLIYENLSDENKQIFSDILDNQPDQLVDFLEQLEIEYGR